MKIIEKFILENISSNIKYYSSLENACFTHNKEENERIKKMIKPYISTWIESNAYYIDELLELTYTRDTDRLKELGTKTFDLWAYSNREDMKR